MRCPVCGAETARRLLVVPDGPRAVVDGRRIRPERPQALHVLDLLARNPDGLTAAQLRERLEARGFASQTTVRQIVHHLRRALLTMPLMVVSTMGRGETPYRLEWTDGRGKK